MSSWAFTNSGFVKHARPTTSGKGIESSADDASSSSDDSASAAQASRSPEKQQREVRKRGSDSFDEDEEGTTAPMTMRSSGPFQNAFSAVAAPAKAQRQARLTAFTTAVENMSVAEATKLLTHTDEAMRELEMNERSSRSRNYYKDTSIEVLDAEHYHLKVWDKAANATKSRGPAMRQLEMNPRRNYMSEEVKDTWSSHADSKAAHIARRHKQRGEMYRKLMFLYKRAYSDAIHMACLQKMPKDQWPEGFDTNGPPDQTLQEMRLFLDRK